MPAFLRDKSSAPGPFLVGQLDTYGAPVRRVPSPPGEPAVAELELRAPTLNSQSGRLATRGFSVDPVKICTNMTAL